MPNSCMKIKNAPKSLQNLPKGYHLDSGDYRALNKYREEKSIKIRKEKKNESRF